MPLYARSRSKQTYSQHQLLVLVVLRQLLAKSYRDLVDIVSPMTPLLRRLRLKRRTSPRCTSSRFVSRRTFWTACCSRSGVPFSFKGAPVHPFAQDVIIIHFHASWPHCLGANFIVRTRSAPCPYIHPARPEVMDRARSRRPASIAPMPCSLSPFRPTGRDQRGRGSNVEGCS